jgi:carbon-monoxide dehydrogenase medium subunit
MIPAAFEYHAPTSLEEAIALLARHRDEASVLAGGQSLIPMMKLRLAAPGHLIDINRIRALADMRETDGGLEIGALTRESDVEASDLVRARYPILTDTSLVIGDPLIRNLATVGGNLAHGDPANDHPATMLVLGAEMVAAGPGGERRIQAASFFTGPFATALEPGEILVGIRVPAPPPRSGGAYVKLERKVGDFATAAVAAQVTLGPDGVCSRAGIGLTNVGPTAIQARRAEAFCQGKRLDDTVLREAGRLAAEEAEPNEDLRGSVEYKRDLVRVLTARALRRAADRAGGNQQGAASRRP